jgi:hypothetical protein
VASHLLLVTPSLTPLFLWLGPPWQDDLNDLGVRLANLCHVVKLARLAEGAFVGRAVGEGCLELLPEVPCACPERRLRFLCRGSGLCFWF